MYVFIHLIGDSHCNQEYFRYWTKASNIMGGSGQCPMEAEDSLPTQGQRGSQQEQNSHCFGERLLGHHTVSTH